MKKYFITEITPEENQCLSLTIQTGDIRFVAYLSKEEVGHLLECLLYTYNRMVEECE